MTNIATTCAIAILASTVPAYAYLDPGTGSIILQAVIGSIAAGLFIFRGYYYRFRGWLGFPHNNSKKNNRPEKSEH